MVFDIKQFKDIFLSEAEDHLAKMNANLLNLEKNIKANYAGQILKSPIAAKDSALLDELMRSAHTIKSSAATMGYVKMAFFTHVLEDVFDYARNKIIPLNLAAIDEIFAGIDALGRSAAAIKATDTELDVEDISNKIKNITGVATSGIGKSARDQSGRPLVSIKKTKKSAKHVDIAPADKSKEAVAVIAEGEQISHIKVPVNRLETLMDLTEEILIDKMRLTNMVNNTIQEARTIADITRRETMLGIKPTIDHLSRLLSSLQFSVMQMRLVPVGNIFSRFPRMVRDLAKSKNKEIELVTKGEDLEVDRSIIDKLGEPVVHLLRNAIDHGIEKRGEIILEAKREKDFVLIIIEDNGIGIDWRAVVEAAIKKEIIAADAGADLIKKIAVQPQSEWQREAENLLFTGRVSTKKQVSETSGRGVGLSVVKKFTEEIGGSLYVESPVHSNGGARFILELPLTLAITEALLVQINQEIFALPFSSIDRVVKVESGDIKSVGDQDVAVVGETEVPLANLNKIFNLLRTEIVRPGANSAKTVVLARRGRDNAGIMVDKVLSQQQIIVKPLPAILKGVKGFSGSTIMGNGEVVLIIDVVSLLQNNFDLLRV